MIRSVLKFMVKESGDEVRRNKVSDLLYCLIYNMELEQLFPHGGYFLGRTELAAKVSVINSIHALLGVPDYSDPDQIIWIYDDLNIRAWTEKTCEQEIFKVEVSHKI